MIEDLKTFFFTNLVNFISNLVNIAFSPINNLLLRNFPNIDNFLELIYSAFDYVVQYVAFALDFSFINKAVFTYLITSLIFRVVVTSSSYLTKLIVKWWHQLAP